MNIAMNTDWNKYTYVPAPNDFMSKITDSGSHVTSRRQINFVVDGPKQKHSEITWAC